MEDWIDIINDETADGDSDRLVLPPPQTVDLNAQGNLVKEIKYKFDENDAENIVRTETKYEIIDVKRKISKAAELRQRNWVKFGACKSVPKGKLERGITSVREANFPFYFNDRDGKRVERPQPQANTLNKPVRRPVVEEKKKDDDNKPSVYRPPSFGGGAGGYVPPGRRQGLSHFDSVFDEEDKVEIKISNLPQWAEFINIKHLVDEFYRHHLGRRSIPKYKIRMIPSKRTLETWNADPKMYENRLAEYERLAIVEFENEESAKKAIKILDGHQYDAHILRVEKAKPRM
eukprot:CAMPEP_0197021176 /NCGR_PEP_ID=MMETSP1384-20130603/2074_1 /TAXON_ID=29189 /ORGANISM="Ammonia sp." /LENGTH=288 /DNA_ID=CAMNT_0042448945 /DNA_START=31 /DNA_END=897 /DNA_ORIENTATION=+